MKSIKVILVEAILFIAVLIFLAIENIIAIIGSIVVITGLLIFLSKKYGLEKLILEDVNAKPKLSKGILLFLVILLPVCFLNNHYILHVITFALIYIVSSLGLNFQLGSLGMVNFAQSTFMGIGAYVSAIFATRLGAPFLLGLLASIVVTGILGILLGYPSLKTKSFYLSLVSIAFCFIAFLIIHNLDLVGGPNGIAGITKPKIFGHSMARPLKIFGTYFPGEILYYYLCLIFVLFSIVTSKRIHNSWIGLAWNAIKEDEIASGCYGIPIKRYKILSFILGSILAGIAGTLYAHFIGFVSPENLSFSVGLLFVCIVMLGGMDNITGVTLGAVLLVVIPEKFRAFDDFRLLFYGTVLVLMLLFRQKGLIPFKVRKYNEIKNEG